MYGLCLKESMESKKGKVLIVDDSELNRALLSDILQGIYEVVEATNGAEALEVLKKSNAEISLVLLDVVMPVMDGYEVLAEMNKLGLIQNIPVVMITSGNAGAYIDRAYNLGAVDYVSRPFNKRTVLHRVTCNYMFSLSQKEMSESMGALFKSAGTDDSARLVKQIEHERLKYKYLADISREIMFEYVVSPQMIKLSDWSAESLRLPSSIVNPVENDEWCKIIPKEDFEQLLAEIHATTPQNTVVSRQFLSARSGEEKWYQVIGKALWTDEPLELKGAVCKIIDINETTVELHNLQRRAEHDALTGLLNRSTAKRRIQALLEAGEGKHYMMLFFDIDDFKQANDTYGHLFGDDVIKEVAERIKANTRSSDIVARIGGDEFLVFMETPADIEALAERVMKRLSGKFREFDVRISMGIALATDDCVDYDTLLGYADAAMYSVKRDGKGGFAFYEEGMPLVDSQLLTVKDEDETGGVNISEC